jgi:hypothetical protein
MGNTDRIVVLVDARMKTKFHLLCIEHGTSMGSVCRDAITAYIRQHDRTGVMAE